MLRGLALQRKRLKECLQLSEAKGKEIQPIIKEGFNKRRNIAESYRLKKLRNRQAMISEMDELKKNMERQLEKILSKQQMALFREIQEKQRAMHDKMMPETHDFGEFSE